MGELLHCSTARQADGGIQSGIIPLLSRTRRGQDLQQLWPQRRKPAQAVRDNQAIWQFAIGETNETYKRYVFNSRDQKEGESIDDYVGELRTLAQTCNFCTCLHSTLIRDWIVLGLRDGGMRKRLLCQGKLTLQKCIEIAKSDEVSNTQLKNMDQTTQEPEDVHKVMMERPKKPEHKRQAMWFLWAKTS